MPNYLRKFGVELELDTFAATSSVWLDLNQVSRKLKHPIINVGYYRSSGGWSWDIKTDSSCGVEVASPALTLNEWDDVVRVCLLLKDSGYQTTGRCGVHVHHGIGDYRFRTKVKFLRWWSLLERAFLALNAPERRNNRYCRPLNFSWETVDAISPALVRGLTYRAVRFRRHTLEFRTLEGTLDVAKIYDWVVLTQSLVDVARRATRLQTMARLTSQPLSTRFKTFVTIAAEPYRKDKQDPIHKVLDSAVAIVEKL